MMLNLEELSAAELLVARIAANTSPSAALAFSGHFLSSNFGRSLSATEARICDGALLILARTERLSVRAQLAGILASVEDGPVRTVTHLAYDLDVEVAGPLLRRSPLIAEDDLVAIARTRPQDHLAALARRESISAVVADILLTRGDASVLQVLAGHAALGTCVRSHPGIAVAGATSGPSRRPVGSPPSPSRTRRREERIEQMTLRVIDGGQQPPGEPEA